MARYLQRQAQARDLGLDTLDPTEIVPFEAGPVQPVDAQLALDESAVALRLFGPDLVRQTPKAPAGWVALVAQSEPQVAVAFCVGNFPQLVRDFHRLLQPLDLTTLRPRPGAPVAAPAFLEWAEQVGRQPAFPQIFFTLGGLRLARRFEEAEQLVRRTSEIPTACRAAWENEVAALAWHQGKAEEAAAAWQTQAPSLPVRFNQAMAELFLGRPGAARGVLESVMAELPEDGAWHHLARLYHTLSVLRG